MSGEDDIKRISVGCELGQALPAVSHRGSWCSRVSAAVLGSPLRGGGPWAGPQEGRGLTVLFTAVALAPRMWPGHRPPLHLKKNE